MFAAGKAPMPVAEDDSPPSAAAAEPARTSLTPPDSVSIKKGKDKRQAEAAGAKPRGGLKKGGAGGLQSVDFTTALLMTRELANAIVPARVENAFQIDAFNLAFGLRMVEGSEWLNISWHPQGARCHIGPAPPKGKEQQSYSFSQQLRTLLKGLTLVRVELAAPFERVVAFSFAQRLTDAPTHRLYVEIMGSRSNAVATTLEGGAEVVACCAYQVSPTRSVRPIGVGQAYAPPPPLTARRPSPEEPLDSFTEYIGRVPTSTLKKALVGCYQGVSPNLVEAMAAAVPGLRAGDKMGEIDAALIAALYSGPWQEWLEVVYLGSQQGAAAAAQAGNDAQQGGAVRLPPCIQPTLKRDGSGYYPLTFTPVGQGIPQSDPLVITARPASQSQAASGFHLSVVAPLSVAMSQYYAGRVEGGSFLDLQGRCAARLSSTLTRLRSRADEFERQLAASGEDAIAGLNMKGDLLTTYAPNWVPGERSVTCQDFKTGEDVAVELSVRTNAGGESIILTPLQEAQLAYKTAKKLRRGAETIRALLQQAQAQVEYAESVEVALAQLRPPPADDWEVLQGFADELGVGGGKGKSDQRQFLDTFGTKQLQKGGSEAPKGKKGKKAPAGKGGKGGPAKGDAQQKGSIKGLTHYRTPEAGFVVLVGRNNLQNERITFQVARAHEIWLHARGVPGSHVLVRCDPGQDLPDADLKFAADIAAYFSKARNSSNVPVDRVSPKGISRVPGAGPGMVQFDKTEVIWGDPRRAQALVEGGDAPLAQ